MKRKFYIGFVILVIVLMTLVLYRYYYGIWNPVEYPKRIHLYGREFHNSLKTGTFSENDKPKYFIYSLNLLTGKKIYSMLPKGEFVPTVVFLHLEKNTYIPYELSGGP